MTAKKRGCYDALLSDVVGLRNECEAAARIMPESLDPGGYVRNAYGTMTKMLDKIIAANAKPEAS